jgi:hypothetical protein
MPARCRAPAPLVAPVCLLRAHRAGTANPEAPRDPGEVELGLELCLLRPQTLAILSPKLTRLLEVLTRQMGLSELRPALSALIVNIGTEPRVRIFPC